MKIYINAVLAPKIISFLVFSCFAFLPLFSQPVLQWSNYPGTVAVALDEFENVYTANWDFNPGGDITITKRDSAGNILWEVPSNNIDNTRHEVATWIETDRFNRVIVSGTIRSGISNPVNVNGILMKYNENGTLLWNVYTGEEFDGSRNVKCILDSLDNIYVLNLGNTPMGMRMQVKKYNPEGNLVWTYNDETGIGSPHNIKLSLDGALIIQARSATGNMNGVAKVDLNGNLMWNQTGIPSATIGDATCDAAGNTYIIHGDNQVGLNQSILEKRSVSGELIWTATHPMAAFRVELGTDQYPIIGGFPNVNSPGVSFAKFNSAGDLLWENIDADGPAYGLLAHAMMKIDENGAAYIAGGTLSQMAICKVNSDGTTAYTVSAPSGYPVDFDFGFNGALYLGGGTTVKFGNSQLITGSETIANKPFLNRILPNPATINETILIRCFELEKLSVMNHSGQLVFEQKIKQKQETVEVKISQSGVYYVVFFGLNGSVKSEKMILR
jgi:hypothetical protein